MTATYAVTNKYRGQALIIVNEKFEDKEHDHDRDGAKADARKMVALFKALDFRVTLFMDLTGEQMKTVLKQAKEHENNKCSDCFVLVISSHGQESVDNKSSRICQEVFGVDMGKDKGVIFLDDIIKDFNNEVTLKGKPKLFFIQACRSRKGVGKIDKGVDVPTTGNLERKPVLKDDGHDALAKINDICSREHVEDINRHWIFSDSSSSSLVELQPDAKLPPDQADGSIETIRFRLGITNPKTKPELDTSTSDKIFDTNAKPSEDASQKLPSPTVTTPKPGVDAVINLNLPENFLLVFPAMSGKGAIRDPATGSLLFSGMLERQAELINGCDILHFLTLVANNMASEDILYNGEAYKSCLWIQHRLTDKVCFKPKGNNSIMAEMQKSMKIN